MDNLLKGPQCELIWSKALSNAWSQLSHGNIRGVQSRDTITYISQQEFPTGSTVTYATCICDHIPLKTEYWWVRLVIGGDKLDYHPDVGSPAFNLTETKILITSVISDAHKGARFLSMGIT